MSTLTTETSQPKQLGETKPKQQEKKPNQLLKQLKLVIIVFAITGFLAYDYHIVQQRELEDELNQKWNHRIAKIERENNRLNDKLTELTEELNNLQKQTEEQAREIEALKQENQKLQTKLKNAQVALNNPWINGTIIARFYRPTTINQIVGPLVIDFPKNTQFNITVLSRAGWNISVLWTNKQLTSFEGQIRQNVTKLGNPNVSSLHKPFSEYRAPAEADIYVNAPTEFLWTDKEIESFMTLIDPKDNLSVVIVKTLDYVYEMEKNNLAGQCTTTSRKAIELLRSMGIPCRTAASYLSGYWDSSTKSRLTLLHAHVQVYIDGCWLQYNANKQGWAEERLINLQVTPHYTTFMQSLRELNEPIPAALKLQHKTSSRKVSTNTFEIIIKIQHPPSTT